MPPKSIKIGTRGSELAIAQSKIVKTALKNGFPEAEITLHEIQTQGDKDVKTPLSELGGKGVFIKEIESALIEKKIDIAIHSFKDITTNLAPGTQIAAVLNPESQADCLLSTKYKSIEELPKGAIIETASLRRQTLLKDHYPNLKTRDIRGNVGTRIQKHNDAPDSAAIMLSEAGLIRLGLTDKIIHRFSPDQFLPAPGQGVIAVQCRSTDSELIDKLSTIADPKQTQISKIEFGLLEKIEFNCKVPLGVYTQIKKDTLTIKIQAAHPTTHQILKLEKDIPLTKAEKEVAVLGKNLKDWMDLNG